MIVFTKPLSLHFGVMSTKAIFGTLTIIAVCRSSESGIKKQGCQWAISTLAPIKGQMWYFWYSVDTGLTYLFNVINARLFDNQ